MSDYNMTTGGDTCMTCGGLIAIPGMAYGYAGKFCLCIKEPQICRPMNLGGIIGVAQIDWDKKQNEIIKLQSELAEIKADIVRKDAEIEGKDRIIQQFVDGDRMIQISSDFWVTRGDNGFYREMTEEEQLKESI